MFVVLIAVGPGEIEVERTLDLLDSVAAHEPAGPACVAILDDAPTPRDWRSLLSLPESYRLLVVTHPRRESGAAELPRTTLGPLCEGLLQAISRIADDVPLDRLRFVLRLDTDALVIAPFAAQIEQSFGRAADIGMIGACRTTPNGSVRVIAHHADVMRALHVPPMIWRNPVSVFRHWQSELGRAPANRAWGRMSLAIESARQNGYRYGRHCLGGAFAVSAEFVRRLRRGGYLQSPADWNSATCGDDVMLSMLTHAVGLHMADAVDDGEPFGVRHVGLADSPPRLLERGYSIIHSVKNDAQLSEDEIRSFFRERRRQHVPSSTS